MLEGKESKKFKGVKKLVVENSITHENYKTVCSLEKNNYVR